MERFNIPAGEIKQKLISIYNALDKVPVQGRYSCATISGSMAILEEIITSYEKVELSNSDSLGVTISEEGG